MNYRRVSTEAILKGIVRKDAAWRIISDFKGFPKLMSNVDKIVIHDRSDEKGKSEWFFTLDNAPLHWLEQDHFDPLNYEIKFESIDGDFDRISGAWKIEDHKGVGIKLNYSVDYHLGIPVIDEVVGDIFQEKMKKSIDSMVQSVTDELSRPIRIEERKHPRVHMNQYNTITVNGKTLRLKILNISRQGMMFVSHRKIGPGEMDFAVEGKVIKAEVLSSADSPNKTRAVFQREIRQDELDHILHYFTTKNLRSNMRLLIEKNTVLISADKRIPVHLVNISPGGMLIKHFDIRDVLDDVFEIEGVQFVPFKKNYDTVAKTLRIQYTKRLSESDFKEIIAKFENSSRRLVEMQIA
jgi:ribosome-associated toxin RatA of RatAB toxin-antitoxin module